MVVDDLIVGADSSPTTVNSNASQGQEDEYTGQEHRLPLSVEAQDVDEEEDDDEPRDHDNKVFGAAGAADCGAGGSSVGSPSSNRRSSSNSSSSSSRGSLHTKFSAQRRSGDVLAGNQQNWAPELWALAGQQRVRLEHRTRRPTGTIGGLE